MLTAWELLDFYTQLSRLSTGSLLACKTLAKWRTLHPAESNLSLLAVQDDVFLPMLTAWESLDSARNCPCLSC